MYDILLLLLVYAPMITAHMRTHKENTYMSENTSTHTYDQMWEKAHKALCEGMWGTARSYIDDLNTYMVEKAVDELPTLSDIRLGHGRTCPGPYADVLRDRISLWNSHVRRKWGI